MLKLALRNWWFLAWVQEWKDSVLFKRQATENLIMLQSSSYKQLGSSDR